MWYCAKKYAKFAIEIWKFEEIVVEKPLTGHHVFLVFHDRRLCSQNQNREKWLKNNWLLIVIANNPCKSAKKRNQRKIE